MEITYREPQTPLWSSSLCKSRDANTTGESEHNTVCDATVGITNSYAPNICIYPPMF